MASVHLQCRVSRWRGYARAARAAQDDAELPFGAFLLTPWPRTGIVRLSPVPHWAGGPAAGAAPPACVPARTRGGPRAARSAPCARRPHRRGRAVGGRPNACRSQASAAPPLAVGLLGGAAIGAASSYPRYEPDACARGEPFACDDVLPGTGATRANKTLLGGIGGAVLGSVAGSLVGLLWRWETVAGTTSPLLPAHLGTPTSRRHRVVELRARGASWPLQAARSRRRRRSEPPPAPPMREVDDERCRGRGPGRERRLRGELR